MVPSYFSNFGILNLGSMTTSGAKLNSLGSTLPRSSTPLISFSFLSKRLHLCCMSTYFDRPNESFLNLPCSLRSSEFGSMDGSMPSVQDAGPSCKLGSSVISFPFVKFVTTFVIQAIFSCISCSPFFISSILMFFSLAMFDLTILDPFLVLWLQIPWNVQNSNQLGLLGVIFLLCIVDAQFCPGYCVYFHFGPRAQLWRVSNLDLKPLSCILLFILSSLWVIMC